MNILDRLIIGIMLLSILARVNGGNPEWYPTLSVIVWVGASVVLELARMEE